MKRLDDITRSHIFFIIDCNKSIGKRIQELAAAGYKAELMLVPQVSSIKSLHKWGDHYRFQVSVAKGNSKGMYAYCIKFKLDFDDIINVDLKEFEDDYYRYVRVNDDDLEKTYMINDKVEKVTYTVTFKSEHLFGNVYSKFKIKKNLILNK